ncbi:Guanine nucleotide-binding protein subunit alpha-12 [Labeo rohita]|uniref:Guanine nucleotide-binding protein subunit alpha-12 n=1 Tax=Labeo rohita TaxID=84645 RepID=A0ABQ8N0U7_LABRO|nr:guanine nucleotide-binding protein subunit alpha-12 isoform X1 [Labeo rohita]KAI2668719.1 Guanine nucleotide-binding protein subunit alpha-12 [Labeo rohita]
MSTALRGLSQCFLPDRSDARRRSREIDAMLKRDRQIPVVILMAGFNKSGKTTFFKQMRLINGAEYNQREVLEFREAIYDNIMKGMRVLVEERNKLGIPLQNSANERHEMLCSSHDWCMKLEPCTFQPYVEAIDSLWKDSGIQEAHRRRSNFKFYESVKYFCDNIHRIGQLNYLPCNQDILYAHTVGQQYCVLRDTPFMVAEFQSWRRHLFKTVSCLSSAVFFFIIGCSDYDQTDFEDNYLVGTLNTFECFCKNGFFRNCPFILFFNKMDLLAEKVQTADIQKHFPEFQGDPHRLEDVQEFLVQSFEKRKWDDSRQIFYHMTTAVDTENFQKMFESVKDTIMGLILKNISLL